MAGDRPPPPTPKPPPEVKPPAPPDVKPPRPEGTPGDAKPHTPDAGKKTDKAAADLVKAGGDPLKQPGTRPDNPKTTDRQQRLVKPGGDPLARGARPEAKAAEGKQTPERSAPARETPPASSTDDAPRGKVKEVDDSKQISAGEITVVNDRSKEGWFASATRVGEVYMTSVATMVDAVIGKLAHVGFERGPLSDRPPAIPLIGESPVRIERLNILDHGNKHSIEIGDDRITAQNLQTYEPELRKLRGKFTEHGFVHLQHCDAGQDKALIVGLARILGVPVYAGTGGHNPVLRFNLGDYVRGDPDGSYHVPVRRPGSLPHNIPRDIPRGPKF